MTFSSPTAALTASILGTTVAQASTAVIANAYNSTGTAQTSISGQPGSYPLLYGTAGNAGQQLATPGSIPTQNGYAAVAATAAQTTQGNSVNGVPGYGNGQGVAQNQACRPDVYIPNVFDLIYQQILAQTTYLARP
jgi:hypothetical protein